jgi:son of sevenless-like protein
MTDLTFVLDGNPTLLYNDRLVNVEKFVKLGGILAEIKQFQNVNYNLVYIKEIQEFLDGGLSVARDADTLFELSLEVEPREREDEKILRLLVEKGFG